MQHTDDRKHIFFKLHYIQLQVTPISLSVWSYYPEATTTSAITWWCVLYRFNLSIGSFYVFTVFNLA